MIWVAGSTANDLEDANNSIDYVIDRDTDYLDCIDNSDDFEEMFDWCILPFVEDLRDTYK